MTNREFAKEMLFNRRVFIRRFFPLIFFLPVNIFDFPTDLNIAGFEMFHSRSPPSYLSALGFLYYEEY